MKKLLVLLFATLMCGAMAAQSTPKMPRHLYVAGQADGGKTKVYNCNTKEVKYVNGHLCNIGVDNNGNVYILVCSDYRGWGNYYVYKNFDDKNPYLSFVWNQQEGIYSSMAMKVKGNNVIVAGVQSLGFNDKGYQSRMFGYLNGKRIFMTGYDRKSLKYENFRGHLKIVGSGLDARLTTYSENFSYNPQCDYLSCVYRVSDVDYYGGAIYTTGWGEREYSDNIMSNKYYLVRRCPRVWKNGAEIIAQYENKTGAAWHINVLQKDGIEYIFTSGHKGSLGYAWEHSTEQYSDISATYPGFRKEATFYVGSNENGHIFCRVFLAQKKAGQVLECGAVIQNGKKLYSWGGSVDNSFDLVAVSNGFYKLTRLPNEDLIIHYQKKYVFDGRYYRYLESDDITVPAGIIDGREPMLAVAE